MSDATVNKCEFYNECDKKVPYYSDIACLNDFSEICTFKQLKRLQAENEELKKENTELQEKFLDLNGKSYSYYKALEEIREMVNEPCVPSENDCLTCPTSCFTKDILIKINEVLK